MKNFKRFASAILALTLALSLTACGGSKETASDAPADTGDSAPAEETAKVYKIGISQYGEHASLDNCREGFLQGLAEAGLVEGTDFEVDYQNAGFDDSIATQIGQSFSAAGVDLMVAIATPSATACYAAAEDKDIPVIFTAITDPVQAKLDSGNVTGTSDLTPIKEQMELLQQLFPDAKTVGILYCSAESNSDIQATMAEDAAKDLSLSTERYTVSSSNEIQQVVESMVGKVDVCYAPTDNTIAAGMSTVTMVANDNGLPVIAGEENMVANGALASYSINYHDLGYKAGQMAVKILQDGDDPADMAIADLDADEGTLVVHSDTASALGVDISGLDGATDLAGTAE